MNVVCCTTHTRTRGPNVDLEASHSGCISWWRNEGDNTLERGEEAGEWDPEALKGFERKKDDDGVWKWAKTDSKDIPEALF